MNKGAPLSSSAVPSPAPALASAQRTIMTEISGLQEMQDALSRDDAGSLGQAFLAASQLLITSKGRVVLTGMGKSGHVGRKIAATLASTGTPAYYVHPAEASHGDLGMVQQGDTIIALSWSGETAELSDIVGFAKRFRVALIAITSNPESTLAREADVALVLPKAREACPNGLAPTTSTTMQMVLGDALAVALLESRGFTAEDFRAYHPGGKLGAKLTFVRDIMHGGAAVPKVLTGTKMSDAIVEMTARGFGCVAVVDGKGMLLGMITDGDLRRHMQLDLLAKTVDVVMNKTPRCITPTILAVEALDILNERRVTALLVVDAQNTPVGIVHVHDLLRIGAA